MIDRTFASDPNPIDGLVKDYALSEAGGGVPLNEQAVLVGAAASLRYLATTSVVGAGGWPDAELLGTAVLGSDDILVLTAAGQRYAIDRERFLALTPAHSAGDSLILSDLLGSSDTDVRRIVSDAGTHSVLVARTADNRPLWQATSEAGFSTVGNGDTVQVYAEEWRGGLIGQRHNTLLGHRRVTASLRIRSATTPADPTNPTFDGEHARATGYYAYDEALPAGSDPVWLLTAEVSYDVGSASWSFGTWSKAREDSAFDLQFAASESGPWHSPIESGDTHARQRRSDGTFSVFAIGGTPATVDQGWHVLRAFHITDAHTSYSQGTYLLNFGFLPSEWGIMEANWAWADYEPQNASYLIPADRIVVRPHSERNSNITGRALKVAWNRGGTVNNYLTMGAQNTASHGSANNQAMTIQFINHTTTPATPAGTASHLYVTSLGDVACKGTLTIRVKR